MKNNNNINRLITKVTSARWLIVVLLTLALCYLTFTGQIGAEVFIAVYSPIIAYYFSKDRKEGEK